MSDTVKAWIEERRAIHREATEDTARVLWDHDDPEGESPNENFDSEPKWEQERLKQAAQAVLESSDAHNMFPRALDALNAALEVLDSWEPPDPCRGPDITKCVDCLQGQEMRKAIEGAISDER